MNPPACLAASLSHLAGQTMGTPALFTERFTTRLGDRGLATDLSPDLDHDDDGSTLLCEYAFGLTEGHRMALVKNQGQLAASMPLMRDELTYQLEYSGNLTKWDVLSTFTGQNGVLVGNLPDTTAGEGFYRITAFAESQPPVPTPSKRRTPPTTVS